MCASYTRKNTSYIFNYLILNAHCSVSLFGSKSKAHCEYRKNCADKETDYEPQC